MADITGDWWRDGLPQSVFEELHPNGGFLHFRPSTPQQVAVRNRITSLGQQFGWPLHGLFVSGTGHTPHFALHVSEFPPQTGAQAQRAEKLQTAIDKLITDIYADVQLTEDPTDLFTYLVFTCHIFNYKSQLVTMLPRQPGFGDFAMSGIRDTREPPEDPTWWQVYL